MGCTRQMSIDKSRPQAEQLHLFSSLLILSVIGTSLVLLSTDRDIHNLYKYYESKYYKEFVLI